MGSPKYWEATPTVAPSMQIAHENLQKKVILNVRFLDNQLPVVEFKCPRVNIYFVEFEIVLEIQQQMRHVGVGKILTLSNLRSLCCLHNLCKKR